MKSYEKNNDDIKKQKLKNHLHTNFDNYVDKHDC